jgi:hypothetical protein
MRTVIPRHPRDRQSRIAHQLMVPIAMGLPPPPAGPKTTFLLRLWHYCTVNYTHWPEYRVDRMEMPAGPQYLRWLLGSPDHAAAVIAAAKTDPAAAAAIAELIRLAHQARTVRETGRTLAAAITRSEKLWLAAMPL